ncbi:hypothetical protein GWN91_02770, partial [Candidatus Saccharibacteria bacterium]|nr:hypothetical protein [Candidatus Saccharibacteria bacterium]NIV71808.1 hypothetical protein [Calditrichia bacterium]NIW78778.1 hypothetical protein [Calditrichia bacterium]
MFRIFSITIMVLILAFMSGCNDNTPDQQASQKARQNLRDNFTTSSPSQGLQLPHHLLIVLRQEMRKIEVGMGQLLSNLAQGRGIEAEKIARNIHDSFILKQELSKEDLEQLISLLPKLFVKLDRGFHQSALEVAEAAGQNQFAKAIVSYSEMAQACVNCHSQFATHRFP